MSRIFLASLLICVLGCTRTIEQPLATSNSTSATTSLASASGTPFGDLLIAEPVTYKNLTLFPIYSKEPKNEDRFITLDEGLAAGTVRIVEVGAVSNGSAADDPFSNSSQSAGDDPFVEPSRPADNDPFVTRDDADRVRASANRQEPLGGQPGNTPAIAPPAASGQPSDDSPVGELPQRRVSEPAGEVNTLLVYNTSGRPLYLMPGEIISGGKQDRTIGQEIVIQASPEPVPIEVYCVEPGRWSGRSVADTSQMLANAGEFPGNLSLVVSQHQDLQQLSEQAQRGEFVTSVGQLNKNVRLAVQQTQNQNTVWDEVAKTNAQTGNATETGNFAANYFHPEADSELGPYVEALLPVAERKRIVGVAVAVNGKMLSADWFESTPLFRKYFLKLLKSYALDAIAAATSQGDDDSQPEACTIKECLAFLQEVAEAKPESIAHHDGQRNDRRESARGVSFSYYDADAAADAGVEGQPMQAASGGFGGFGGGGFGGAVHGGTFAK